MILHHTIHMFYLDWYLLVVNESFSYLHIFLIFMTIDHFPLAIHYHDISSKAVSWTISPIIDIELG